MATLVDDERPLEPRHTLTKVMAIATGRPGVPCLATMRTKTHAAASTPSSPSRRAPSPERGVRRRRQALSLVGLAMLGSCVQTPRSNTPGITDAQVSFSGTSSKDVTALVWIEVLGRDGSWIRLRPPATVRDDRKWDTTVTVPSEAARQPPCQSATFHAVDDAGRVLAGSDASCVAGLGPHPTLLQLVSCTTSTVTLSTNRIESGDVDIVGPEQAAAYACLTRVDGNLTIDGGALTLMPSPVDGRPVYARDQRLALPRLQSVGHHLVISGHHADRLELPVLESVGGDLDLTLHAFPVDGADFPETATKIVAPRLTTVHGTLRLATSDEPHAANRRRHLPFRYGLESLTEVHGIEATDSVSITEQTGLSGLTDVLGSVRIEWTSELGNDTLLPNLETIHGDLTVLPHQQLLGLFPKLTHVTGNVVVQPAPETNCILKGAGPKVLGTVDGALSIESCQGETSTTFLPALTQVRGQLSVLHGNPFKIGSSTAPLRVGGLVVSKTTSAHIPLPDVVQVVRPPGTLAVPPVTVASNTSICQCEVDQFVTCLARGGWTGVAATTGNRSCDPCPVTSTCAPAVLPP